MFKVAIVIVTRRWKYRQWPSKKKAVVWTTTDCCIKFLVCDTKQLETPTLRPVIVIATSILSYAFQILSEIIQFYQRWYINMNVPDKTSWGLGSMSRYSAQILICLFFTYITKFSFRLWVGLGICISGLSPCSLALSIVIRIRQPLKTIKSSSILCMGWSIIGWETLWYVWHRSHKTDRNM